MRMHISGRVTCVRILAYNKATFEDLRIVGMKFAHREAGGAWKGSPIPEGAMVGAADVTGEITDPAS